MWVSATRPDGSARHTALAGARRNLVEGANPFGGLWHLWYQVLVLLNRDEKIDTLNFHIKLLDFDRGVHRALA